MKIISSPKQMLKISQQVRRARKTIGFVPTMGALHEGHLSLMRKARRDNDVVVVSIFVNPTQFGPREDFRRYPRPLRRDLGLCRKEKVDFIFYPQAKDMYPQDFKTYVVVKDLSNVLCGKSREGHFQGVVTVVIKLFNIVQPDIAYFGQKDAQQSIIIRRMVDDLNMPVKIKVMPTVREKDGLAMSSRNTYLNARERKDALILNKSLRLAGLLVKSGLRDANRVIQRMKQLIMKKKTAKIDYIAIVDTKNLKPVKRIENRCLIALAVWIGKTRLIDNMVINVNLNV